MHSQLKFLSGRNLAGFEAARGALTLEAPVDRYICHGQVIRYVVALELLSLSQRLPEDPSNWFRVEHVLHLEILSMAPKAAKMIELLSMLAVDAEVGERGRVLDPALKTVFDVMARHFNLRELAQGLTNRLVRNPRYAVDLMSGFLLDLRRSLRHRPQIRRELLHTQKHAELFRQLHGSYRQLAKSHPSAVVLRLELYARADPYEVLFPHAHYASSARRVKRWLERVNQKLGSELLAHSWCPQWGEHGDLGHHVLLLVTGRPVEAILDLQDRCANAWKEFAGRDSYAVPCKSNDTNLSSRGRRLDLPGDSLGAELVDAAHYFAYGHRLIAPSDTAGARRVCVNEPTKSSESKSAKLVKAAATRRKRVKRQVQ